MANVVVVVQGGLVQYAIMDTPGIEIVVKDIDKNNDPVISFSGVETKVDPERVARNLALAREQIENSVDPDPAGDEDAG